MAWEPVALTPTYDYLNMFVKVGDQTCAPGKKLKSVNDGYIAGYIDPHENLRPPGKKDEVAYAIVKVPFSWKPDLDAALQPGYGKSRSKLVTLSELASALGDLSIETGWRNKGQKMPIFNGMGLSKDILKTTEVLNPAAIDFNIITAGNVVIGIDYLTWSLFFADIGNLTGNLTATGDTNYVVVDGGQSILTELLNGFALVCDGGAAANGDGNVTAVAKFTNNLHTFSLQGEGPGSVTMRNFNHLKTNGSYNNGLAFISITTISTALTITIHDNIIRGGNHTAIRCSDSTPTVIAYNNKSYDGRYMLFTDAGGMNANNVFENNECHNPVIAGFDFGNQACADRNNKVWNAGTAAYLNTTNVTRETSAADDITGTAGLQSLNINNEQQTDEPEIVTGSTSWWKMNGDATDEQGNYNGTVLGGMALTTGFLGMPNGAYQGATGLNERINCGDITELNLVSQFTACGWVQQVDPGVAVDIIYGKDITGANRMRFNFWSDNNLYGTLSTSQFGYWNYLPDFGDNTWQHLAVVFDGTLSGNANRLKLFLDGRQMTLNFTGTIPATTQDMVGLDWIFGADNNESLQGQWDNWRVYAGTALSAAQVESLATLSQLGLPSTTAPNILTGGTTPTYATTLMNGRTWSGEIGAMGLDRPQGASLDVNTGPTAGGTAVTITLTGGGSVQGTGSVTIGGVVATIVSWSDTSIQVTTPAGALGAQDVVITSRDGLTQTLVGGFTYADPAPPSGRTAGTTPSKSGISIGVGM